jgi:hypothetical protein
MAIRVDAYTSGGLARGILSRAGPVRDVLEHEGELVLEGVTWMGRTDRTPEPAGFVTIPMDDVLIAVAEDDPGIPVHANWHRISLEAGPYTVEGDLPTMPGFDPGRALTRPSGEFIMLRDVRITVRDRPDDGVATGDHALINRYTVERIRAELMLGFFFPGAEVDAILGGVGTQP